MSITLALEDGVTALPPLPFRNMGKLRHLNWFTFLVWRRRTQTEHQNGEALARYN